jgi:hypothetical protein
MRGGIVSLWVLALTCLWGCPHTFGRGGTIDRAAAEDAEEAAEPFVCPPPEELRKLCADPSSEKCPKPCLK